MVNVHVLVGAERRSEKRIKLVLMFQEVKGRSSITSELFLAAAA